MMDMASAFEAIRDERLYRETHSTFEDYCRERWGLTRQHVNRLVAGARVVQELEPRGSIQPTTEKQVRPLRALPDPEDRAETWQDAVDAAGGQPTARQVEEAVERRNGRVKEHHPAIPAGTFATVVADPPWRYDNWATRGAAEDHYPTMAMEDLAALHVPAADDAHLYLWVTNGFLREGFDLIDAWGFTYKTVLSWCKPSIGMGNYFRNNTEHVLFALKGKLPTERKDVGTWFEAPKTKHSAKPEAFYDLVESCSPGPYLEMFARRQRMGWSVWGDEA